ncbi:MAG TPA: hypothetical protein VF523_02430 [Burkholderiales bacterium]
MSLTLVGDPVLPRSTPWQSPSATLIAVNADAIPREWLPVSTGYIDTRFSMLVGEQLSDLIKKDL